MTQTAWLERGGKPILTQRYETHCTGKCLFPSLEEIRKTRADPGEILSIRWVLFSGFTKCYFADEVRPTALRGSTRSHRHKIKSVAICKEKVIHQYDVDLIHRERAFDGQDVDQNRQYRTMRHMASPSPRIRRQTGRGGRERSRCN